MNFPSNSRAGFTLIELLFAIFIFAIVISSVYGAYRTTFHIIQGSEAILSESHRARAAIERMTEDFTSIVAGPGGYLAGIENELEGRRADSVTFISSTHISFTTKDVLKGDAVIQYTTELDDTDNTVTLLRSDTIKKPGAKAETTGGTNYILCKGLREVRLTYFNQNGEETTEWETESKREADGTVSPPDLPAMVSIELIFPVADSDDSGAKFKTAVALPITFEE